MKYLRKIFEQVNSEQFIDAVILDAARRLSLRDTKKLISEGVDVNIQNKIQRTPLIICVMVANGAQDKIIKMVNLLVENGAKLDIQDSIGDTALIKATYKGRYKVMNRLIELGAEWYIKDKRGEDFLSFLEKPKIKELIEKYPDKYAEYKMKVDAEKYNL